MWEWKIVALNILQVNYDELDGCKLMVLYLNEIEHYMMHLKKILHIRLSIYLANT